MTVEFIDQPDALLELARLAGPWLQPNEIMPFVRGAHCVPPMGLSLAVYNRALSRGESQDFKITHTRVREPLLDTDYGWSVTDGLTTTFPELWSGDGTTPDEAAADLLLRALRRICPSCGYVEDDHAEDCSARIPSTEREALPMS